MSISPENRRLRKRRRERLSLLSEWYGRDFADVEIAAHVSQPQPLTGGIRAVMASLETPEARALRKLRDMWPQVAGEWISKVTVPGELHDGVLLLEVRHNALLRELKPSLELLLEAVNRYSEYRCSEIKLTVAGGAGSIKRTKPTPR